MKTFIISYAYIWEQYFSDYENFNNATYKEAFNDFAEANNCTHIGSNIFETTEEHYLILKLTLPDEVKVTIL
jgi:hypothetical protein